MTIISERERERERERDRERQSEMLFNVEKETDHYRVVNRRTSSLVVLLAITFLTTGASAFVQPSNVVRSYGNGMDGSIPSSRRHMFVDQLSMVDMSTVVSPEYASTIAVSSGLLLAETEPWVQPLAFVLGPFLNFISFAMVRATKQEKSIAIRGHILFPHSTDFAQFSILFYFLLSFQK